MRGLFFAKFDDEAGPVMVCEATNGCSEALSPDLFDRVNDFIITKKDFCGCVLTATDQQSESKVMSCPRSVENDKLYARNEFFFSFGIVFNLSTDSGAYEPVLKKLSSIMESLEVESSYLSQDNCEAVLQPILEQVLQGLLVWGECIVPVDEANIIALKFSPRLVDPPQVFEYQVPVLIRDVDYLITKEWDLTIQQVVKYIDGVRHVKLIAEESSVAMAMVKRCMRQLMYFHCIKLMDIFQYSNIYACTPRIRELAENEELQKSCLRFICKQNQRDLPQLPKVFQLYASMNGLLGIRDIFLLYDTDFMNINDRLFITFGVLNGLIRRIHKHPVHMPSISMDELQGTDALEKYLANAGSKLVGSSLILEESIHDNKPRVKSLVNARNHFDAICTELWRSSDEVDLLLEYDENIGIVYK